MSKPSLLSHIRDSWWTGHNSNKRQTERVYGQVLQVSSCNFPSELGKWNLKLNSGLVRKMLIVQGLCLASGIIIRKKQSLQLPFPPSSHHSLSLPPLSSPSTFLFQRFENCGDGMLGWLGHWIWYLVPASNLPLYLITCFRWRSRAYYSTTSRPKFF